MRFAAVADGAYEDNRMKLYPSLKGTQFDSKLSDDRNVVYYDKKDNSVWWGVRGTQPNLDDLSTDVAIVAQHVGESRFSNLHKLFALPDAVKKSLPVAAKMAMTSRFAKIENKYKQIRKAYGKNSRINVGAHSLGGALSQHLLTTLTPSQQKLVRVHSFNSLPLHGFDPDKYPSYYATKNILDPVSANARGVNLRVIKDQKVGDVIMPDTPRHEMSQFVGRDLNKIPRGHKTSTYESLRGAWRGDAAERAHANAIKIAHKRTREILRKKFIEGLTLKKQPALRKQPTDDADL